jgi:hypothetical protein
MRTHRIIEIKKCIICEKDFPITTSLKKESRKKEYCSNKCAKVISYQKGYELFHYRNRNRSDQLKKKI